MVQTYSDHNKVYSVDMMFAYINIFKPKSKHVKIDDTLLKTLEHKGWGDPKTKTYYSPFDVLKKPKNKKYKDEIERIKKADLRYPIIISADGDIVDGVHRLTKAYLTKKKKIKAYVFTKKQMNKFIIDKARNWNKVDKMETHEFITLFYKRFCKK